MLIVCVYTYECVGFCEMGSEEDGVTQQRVVDARARNISHNVRCTECGSQSIEDSQADIAILLRKVFFLTYNCSHYYTHWKLVLHPSLGMVEYLWLICPGRSNISIFNH